MNKSKLIRRCIFLVIAIFINSFGVAFITKALLGTSPITSVNYVLSLFTALTMGEWTMIVNMIFVVLQLLMMNRQWLRGELSLFLLQIPCAILMGVFIDLSMNMLWWMNPHTYLSQMGSLVVGCIILAVGVALEVQVQLTMMPGEYIVRVFSRRFKKDFGYVKLGFDTTLVTLACIISFYAMSDIEGIREGTVIAAVIVGPMVHWVSPKLMRLHKLTGAPAPVRSN